MPLSGVVPGGGMDCPSTSRYLPLQEAVDEIGQAAGVLPPPRDEVRFQHHLNPAGGGGRALRCPSMVNGSSTR
jgi:hypothetical protein